MRAEQGCISCVDGVRFKFLAANALAMSALEQGVRLKTQAPDALQDIARPAGNALGEAACDFLSNEPGYAANLLCAADDLMNPKGVDPAIVSCATLQQEDALNGGAEGRVEIV